MAIAKAAEAFKTILLNYLKVVAHLPLRVAGVAQVEVPADLLAVAVVANAGDTANEGPNLDKVLLFVT